MAAPTTWLETIVGHNPDFLRPGERHRSRVRPGRQFLFVKTSWLRGTGRTRPTSRALLVRPQSASGQSQRVGRSDRKRLSAFARGQGTGRVIDKSRQLKKCFSLLTLRLSLNYIAVLANRNFLIVRN